MTRMILPPKSRKTVPADEQELYEAAKALYNVYNRRGKNDEKELEFLTGVTKTVFEDKWKLSKNSALIDLLRLAVNKLPDNEFPEGFSKSWKWVAQVLYDFAPKTELEDLQNQLYDYDKRHAFVKKKSDGECGVISAENTFKRHIIWPIRATLVAILKMLEEEGSKERLSDGLTVETISPHARAITELLLAQISAARRLPYWSDDSSKPTLDDVYVPVRLRPLDTPSGQFASFDEALSSSQSLLILGEPGAGKSSLAARSVAQLSAKVLECPSGDASTWVPLYVPARMITNAGSLLTAIAAALTNQLGLSLTTMLDESFLLNIPNNCAGWLIFVDGIDEIIDTTERRRLIQQLSHHIYNQEDSTVRFVLLSRHLDDDELRPFEKRGIVKYCLQSFDDEQLATFADRWSKYGSVVGVSSKDPIETTSGRKFVDALRNPFLATLSVLTPTAFEPVTTYRQGRPTLLTTLYQLCERFTQSLLFDRQRRTKARKQVNAIFEDVGQRGDRLADWIYDNRQSICAHVAHSMLAGDERMALTLAKEHIAASFGDLPYVPDWDEHLSNILIDTGLMYRRAGDIRFIHQTVAEYLAATIDRTIEKLSKVGRAKELREWMVAEEAWHNAYLIFRLLEWSKANDLDGLMQGIVDEFNAKELRRRRLNGDNKYYLEDTMIHAVERDLGRRRGRKSRDPKVL